MFDLTVQNINGEPRMRDLDIAGALGFERGRAIRDLIARCEIHLAGFGEVIRRTVRHINQPGRNPSEYWLNEHQAFYLCTQSKAERAAEVTQQIIRVFVAWRNGQALPGAEVSPLYQVGPDTLTHLALVREARLVKGRAAASWLYDRLPLPPVPDDITALRGTVSRDDGAGITLFLRDECIVSGDARHWTRSLDLFRAYLTFCSEGNEPALSKRLFGNCLRALAAVYRCPESGAQFHPTKRSDTGYRGIRLIPCAN